MTLCSVGRRVPPHPQSKDFFLVKHLLHSNLHPDRKILTPKHLRDSAKIGWVGFLFHALLRERGSIQDVWYKMVFPLPLAMREATVPTLRRLARRNPSSFLQRFPWRRMLRWGICAAIKKCKLWILSFCPCLSHSATRPLYKDNRLLALSLLGLLPYISCNCLTIDLLCNVIYAKRSCSPISKALHLTKSRILDCYQAQIVLSPYG